MERRQLQAAEGSWDRPRYGGGGPAQHPPRFRHEAPQCLPSRLGPRPVLYPGGGPWESRPPYEGSEQRQHGPPQAMPQFRPPPPEGFIHGGPVPGVPHGAPMETARTQGMGAQPGQPHIQGAEGMQPALMPSNGTFPNIPQHRAPDPPQGIMPYNTPLDGTPQPPCAQGRPQPMIPDVPEHRRESQDGIFQSHGGPQRTPDEPPEWPQPRSGHPDVYQPNIFHQGGSSSFRGPDPTLTLYASGGGLSGFQHDPVHNRSNQHHIYQNEGSQGGYQAGLQKSEVFPHGGPGPGVTHSGPIEPVRTQGVGSQPGHPHIQGAGPYGGNGLQPPIMARDGPFPNIPQHRAPEPPQDVMPYNNLLNSAVLPPCAQGRPQPIMADVPEQGRKSQDAIFQSHGGPQPRSGNPDVFHRGGQSSFRGPNPSLASYASGGQQPSGFQHDPLLNRSNQHHMYQGGYQAGLHNLNTPPVSDTFGHRAPSQGIQQFTTQLQPVPTQNTPYTEDLKQGHYNLPPTPGNLHNPSYTPHSAVGSVFGGSLEGDLETPRLQRHHSDPHYLLDQQQSVMHQDRRQGPDPTMPSGMAEDRYFEHDAPFPQHEMPDGHRDPQILRQHGVPFVLQPTPHIEDRQTDIEKDGPSDKDIFVHWLTSFLSCRRKKPPTRPIPVKTYSVAEARELIYGALRLVSQLDSLCQVLENSNKAGEEWTHDYEKAADIRVDLEKKLKELEKPGYIQGVKSKLDRVRKKRLRCQRRNQAAEEEDTAEKERSAEREASIDLWRMQCIQKVEEKKRERELKATADHVLGEVRKKKNDVKKMLDVLKALEKLRKLRKEAAGRKGVCPPASADETFANHIKRLRTMVHNRSALYDAEEKTLRVILEGEQEEERQREKDKRLRKEREKTMQKQRELDSILFGDAEPLPNMHPLQPFRQYYLQAEHSVVSLVEIRHEWDQFLVPPDHPDGSSIPRGWVIPTIPSSETWTTAVKPSD